MLEFAQLVKRERERQGIKGYALAYQVGENPSWVTRLENGEMKRLPSPEVMAALATALGITERTMLKAWGYLATDGDGHSETFDMLDPLERGILKVTPLLTDADKRTILAFSEFLASRK